MKLRILDEAVAEATDAACWYDERAGLGDEFVAEYVRRLREVEHRPRRFGRVETLRTEKEIRRCFLRRFPYRIVYEVLADEVLVLAVAHASQRPNYWRKRGR